MKHLRVVLCLAALAFATVASATTPALRQPLKVRQLTIRRHVPHPKGKWYMASTGHAIYCYGPVMIVGTWDGGLERVATICRGGRTMVKLKD